MTETWLAQAADSFWSLNGGVIAPPRNLTRVVSRGLPISVISLPQLSVARVEHWLARQQVPYSFLCQNRALCGCAVAALGHGLLFIDSEDDEREQRFTVAHEVAHFLLDYQAPRRLALDLFGESIRVVLDGERPPTKAERIDAVLSRATLGVFTDLMPRSAQGGIDQGSILRAEERADRFALELLAPAEEVLTLVSDLASCSFEQLRRLVEVLHDEYGLPATVARPYAAALLPQTKRPSMAQWLGI